MVAKIFSYPVMITESHLDVFGHVNNAMYLTLYEEARWDIISNNGYGLDEIKMSGLGPTILEIQIRFLKEMLLGDQVTIVTHLESYEGKIGVISQKMLRGEEVCSKADFTVALFDLTARKIVLPTPKWLMAIGAVIE